MTRKELDAAGYRRVLRWKAEGPPSALGPVATIAKALQTRDWAGHELILAEQQLASTVADQPDYWQATFGRFRSQGGHTMEQWREWTRHADKRGLHWQRLRVV
jgi:hypothetical protein